MPSLILAQGSSVPGARVTDTLAPADAGVPATTVPVVAPATTIITTPRPIITTVTPVPTPKPSLELEPENLIGDQASSLPEDWFYKYALTLLGVGGVVLLSYEVFKFKKSQNKKNHKDSEERCGSIKELLEQKEKELEDMIKNWPADKLKQVAENKITEQLEKNEETKKLLEIKKKYNETKKTIEMLQKKYDLCMLEIPTSKGSIKSLKFRKSLVSSILDGTKIITWRLFDDKNLRAGDDLEFINFDTGEKFANAKVLNILEKKISEIKKSDYEGHEEYLNQDEIIKHFQEYYEENIDLDTMIKIIRFKLVK